MRFPTNRRSRTPRTTGGAGSMLAVLLPGLSLLCLVFVAVPTAVADSPAVPEDAAGGMQAMMEERLAEVPRGKDGVDRIMGELDERLTLSDEQKTEIRPVIMVTVASMERIADKFKAGEISPMALGMQMQMVGQKAASKVELHLTEAQKAEYEKMRQEQRREMMQAMQRARGLGGPAQAGAQ